MEGDARSFHASVTLAAHIRHRLSIGLVINLGVTAVIIATGLLAYVWMNHSYNEALADVTTAEDELSSLNQAITAEVLNTRAYLIADQGEFLTNRNLALEVFQEKYADLQNTLKRSPIATATLQKLAALHIKNDAIAADMITLHQSGDIEAAVKLFDERSNPLVLEMFAVRQDLQTQIQTTMIHASRDNMHRSGEMVVSVAAAFLIWMMGSSWLVGRRLIPGLDALEYLEHALVETAESGVVNPIRLPMSNSGYHRSLFQAYNSLIAHLERNTALRMEFLAAISHELRSPLASIVGYATLLADPAIRPPNANPDGYADIIVRQAQQMGQIVGDVLTAAKVEDAELDVLLLPLDLGALLGELVEQVKQQQRGREIVFENRLGPALVMGDALRLQQAFMNLMENALKFSSPNQPIHVIARHSPGGESAQVNVTDHGIGIAEADMSILFTRFGRIKNKLTQGISGSGLGLYIVKHILESHGGSIAVYSMPMEGSTFVVTLPLRGRE